MFLLLVLVLLLAVVKVPLIDY